MPVQLDVVIGSMSVDLAGIKQDAQATQATLSCLEEPAPERLQLEVQSLEQQVITSQELLDAKTTGKTASPPSWRYTSSIEIHLYYRDTPPP